MRTGLAKGREDLRRLRRECVLSKRRHFLAGSHFATLFASMENDTGIVVKLTNFECCNGRGSGTGSIAFTQLLRWENEGDSTRGREQVIDRIVIDEHMLMQEKWTAHASFKEN